MHQARRIEIRWIWIERAEELESQGRECYHNTSARQKYAYMVSERTMKNGARGKILERKVNGICVDNTSKADKRHEHGGGHAVVSRWRKKHWHEPESENKNKQKVRS